MSKHFRSFCFLRKMYSPLFLQRTLLSTFHMPGTMLTLFQGVELGCRCPALKSNVALPGETSTQGLA